MLFRSHLGHLQKRTSKSEVVKIKVKEKGRLTNWNKESSKNLICYSPDLLHPLFPFLLSPKIVQRLVVCCCSLPLDDYKCAKQLFVGTTISSRHDMIIEYNHFSYSNSSPVSLTLSLSLSLCLSLSLSLSLSPSLRLSIILSSIILSFPLLNVTIFQFFYFSFSISVSFYRKE